MQQPLLSQQSVNWLLCGSPCSHTAVYVLSPMQLTLSNLSNACVPKGARTSGKVLPARTLSTCMQICTRFTCSAAPRQHTHRFCFGTCSDDGKSGSVHGQRVLGQAQSLSSGCASSHINNHDPGLHWLSMTMQPHINSCHHTIRGTKSPHTSQSCCCS